jgi:hypothetical protein
MRRWSLCDGAGECQKPLGEKRGETARMSTQICVSFALGEIASVVLRNDVGRHVGNRIGGGGTVPDRYLPWVASLGVYLRVPGPKRRGDGVGKEVHRFTPERPRETAPSCLASARCWRGLARRAIDQVPVV